MANLLQISRHKPREDVLPKPTRRFSPAGRGERLCKDIHMKRMIVLNEKDNIAVALDPLTKGTEAALSTGRTLCVCSDIPFAHKAALRPIMKGEPIIKYGLAVGAATRDIASGEHVHVQNMESLRHRVK